ncbi:aminotransferase class V-fold PLP-dependent enzyme [Microbacterium sp. EYE_5]|uniref:pyridoxal phosphate-dependent decarboxylase family protein n=1 Tax=unclassified Microbacterium TaxID=2609290 RepID=UPI0020066ED1|nr:MULTISPECIES: aminotransferase class V-fold PLP-dependent enzyme [unclassified Microbacterium]MCK6080702.1 aminotransferase class V-fold PLP-dependent enzyme [Microbacterium sp. EYE_382]MCK6085973.1 aminotransferase class V-fold PLP-dependent enzyme [Microbacterium sp. EYE_384]MCK6124529.1 aminotransferase class V-fold PLP-dependent enzyme [Microbacterium sp. EYE_80]MCK6127438.1 aminotransferase class V-fold PLP-dependent enzyme [Microbacterium sp. EYE_79]MCK6141657.1 aminotransferase class
MDARERALEVAHREALRFLGSLEDRPVWPRAGVDDMDAVFGGPLPDDGLDPGDVVESLARDADPGLVGIPGGRFFGFVIGGTLPAALAADWLVSAWDQNSGSTTMTTAVAAVERTAGRWVCDLLGLPETASVGFVTGAQVSNTVCLATAQHAVLRRAGWDQVRQGLRGAPPVALVVGAHRHASIDRAARFCGWGSEELVVVPSDDQGRMRVDALAEAMAALAGRPSIVCLQAGEVHTGAFDPFEELIPIARRSGAWVHVDGAFGLWAGASPRLRHLVAGVGGADSWTTDGHKTLNVPYDCGMAIVRDPADSIAMFRTGGDYLMYSRLDPWDVTPELSRRGRGVPAWAALRSLGRSGVASLVEGMCANARRLADGLREMAGVSVVNDVEYTQVMFRLDDDAATRELGAAVLRDGTSAMTGAEWAGRAVIRCSVSSWATTADDVRRTLDAVRSLVPA